MTEFNSASHIQHLDAAIAELLQLEKRTAAPAPIPHQYIGTAVDNAVLFLSACANSLDSGARKITFSQTDNWLSAMKAVHRSFFASLHSVVEAGLTAICEERALTAESAQQRKTDQYLERLSLLVVGNSDALQLIAKLKKLNGSLRTGFQDQLNVVLESSALDETEKRGWRKFFDALGIVRNKSSHPNPALSDNELERLREGGFAVAVSADGRLVMNPRMYHQAATVVLNFFDAILACGQKGKRVSGS